MAKFCVKYGALHEMTFRCVKSQDAAISVAAEKWWPTTDVIRDHAVIVEMTADGGEEIVVDTPHLLTLIQQIHTAEPRH
jgi:hypothetical protein